MQIIIDVLQSIAIIFLARAVSNMASTYQKEKRTEKPEQKTRSQEE